MPLPSAVMLATEDTDLGIVPIEEALAIARVYANSTLETVYVRDPVSDEVLRRVIPSPSLPKRS